jgi:hypothetical protein
MMYEPQSDFQDWCTANLRQIAVSREIRMLLAQAFEGGRVAERKACAKLCELHNGDDRFGPPVTVERIAAAIRERSQA